jgi:hypothetical protein
MPKFGIFLKRIHGSAGRKQSVSGANGAIRTM